MIYEHQLIFRDNNLKTKCSTRVHISPSRQDAETPDTFHGHVVHNYFHLLHVDPQLFICAPV